MGKRLSVEEFEILINNARKYFKTCLVLDFKERSKMDTIISYLDCCTSEFEENTLIENLKEELQDFLKEQRAA